MTERLRLPATFLVDLHYEDPDGDLISLRTDADVKDACLLCRSIGKALKMTLSAARDSVAAGADVQEKASLPDDFTLPEVQTKTARTSVSLSLSMISFTNARTCILR